MASQSVADHFLFMTLVETLSFKKTAEKLKLSSSAVSRQLQRIELELGVTLLNRTTRSLSITEQGQIFFESCIRIEEEKRSTLRQLQDLNAQPLGHLKIAATQTFAHACLVPALARFSDAYPDISFELMISDDFIDLVEAGVDVALRIGRLKDSRLRARRIMQSSLVCCASPAYLERLGEPLKLDDLMSHQLILTSHLSAVMRRYLEAFPQIDLSSANKKLTVNNVLTSYQAALSGMGITYLPSYLITEDLKDGTLKALFTQQIQLPHEVFAVFQNMKTLPSKVRVFIDYLVDELG